jgi:hypothetical protein
MGRGVIYILIFSYALFLKQKRKENCKKKGENNTINYSFTSLTGISKRMNFKIMLKNFFHKH